ncbi:acyl carrier protein [Dongia deserti]|uniref:acyl carrier protein n=1 Tax=Dongia deserti TaxID=2268030 RepID=UPI000E652306|nr:acyl carrier protein [Dongia deserti]
MTKSLFGKNPDLDDVDFIEAIEAAFGIKFGNEEPEKWLTFGDVFDATCRRVHPVERGPFPCLSASAYRHIKRAILKDGPGLDLRPDTPLKDLVRGRRVSGWWRKLERVSGLKLPALQLGLWSTLFFLVLFLGIPLLVAISRSSGWLALLSVALAILVAIWSTRSLPVQTVGDLARSVAALNAQTLSRSHGAIRERDVWSSLVWIARDSTACRDPIDRQTILIG